MNCLTVCHGLHGHHEHEDADAPQVLAEVERLIEELEKHLCYEEEQLIPVLDQA